MVSFLGLAQIILIDLSMAGDNVIVVGLAVAALPLARRRRAMSAGIAVATLLRVVMAFFAVQLLHITGLMAAGGLLLLWVGWKMLREARVLHCCENPAACLDDAPKKFSTAVWQIIAADVSMSLDNVLGVAGVARDHMQELVIGLVLSVALMGIASAQIAKLTVRYPKVGYVGAALIFVTALHMIYDGARDVWPSIHAYV